MSGDPAPDRWLPLALLLGAGGAIGLIFPLAKIAGMLGLSPLTYAALAAAGAAMVLVVFARLWDEPLSATRNEVAYALVAGQLTFAIPFGTLVAIVPLIGSSVPAILQSTAPLATLAIVAVIGFERPGLLRALGLAVGFAGALLVIFARGASFGAGDWIVYALAVITPVSLAAGNVYRSTHWPEGSRALPLAVLTLAAAAAGLVLIALVLRAFGLVGPLLAGPAAGAALILLQALLTGIGYALFFRLQQVGGPVYLSQISYVNTAVGLSVAVLLLGESLPLAGWIAVLLIAAGIILVALDTRR